MYSKVVFFTDNWQPLLTLLFASEKSFKGRLAGKGEETEGRVEYRRQSSSIVTLKDALEVSLSFLEFKVHLNSTLTCALSLIGVLLKADNIQLAILKGRIISYEI